ncbi:uncharacterized protein LOC128869457 [Anastrepha ludens]|uniref:uncharacterized protein LOC128869457 n=1 Tax=Anastrepha ludens TaxID=28586 RepID=UPI0023AEDA93|nr:uncharacterized protein LOC128869457 [Anastrepha ludens]
MFGIKMKVDLESQILDALLDELVDNLDIDRRRIRDDARAQILKTQATCKRNFDKGRKAKIGYTVSDLVAIKRTQFVAGKKFASEYLGPYEIVKVKRNGRYDVRKAANVEGHNNTSTSCDNMRLWKYAECNEELLSSEADDDNQNGRM